MINIGTFHINALNKKGRKFVRSLGNNTEEYSIMIDCDDYVWIYNSPFIHFDSLTKKAHYTIDPGFVINEPFCERVYVNLKYIKRCETKYEDV